MLGNMELMVHFLRERNPKPRPKISVTIQFEYSSIPTTISTPNPPPNDLVTLKDSTLWDADLARFARSLTHYCSPPPHPPPDALK